MSDAEVQYERFARRVDAMFTSRLPQRPMTSTRPDEDDEVPEMLDEEVCDFPTCFYARILSNTLPHRSVSQPVTPRSSVDWTASSKKFTATLKKHNAQRKKISQASSDHLLDSSSFHHSSVSARALQCTIELQELLLYVQEQNAREDEARRQFVVSSRLREDLRENP